MVIFNKPKVHLPKIEFIHPEILAGCIAEALHPQICLWKEEKAVHLPGSTAEKPKYYVSNLNAAELAYLADAWKNLPRLKRAIRTTDGSYLGTVLPYSEFLPYIDTFQNAPNKPIWSLHFCNIGNHVNSQFQAKTEHEEQMRREVESGVLPALSRNGVPTKSWESADRVLMIDAIAYLERCGFQAISTDLADLGDAPASSHISWANEEMTARIGRVESTPIGFTTDIQTRTVRHAVQLPLGTEAVTVRDVPALLALALHPVKNDEPVLMDIFKCAKGSTRTEPLSDDDLSMVMDAWHKLPTRSVRLKKSEWPEYLSAFNTYPSRPEWELVPTWHDPKLNSDMLRLNATNMHAHELSAAIKTKKVIARNHAGIPSEGYPNDEILLNDLRAYARSFGITVEIEDNAVAKASDYPPAMDQPSMAQAATTSASPAPAVAVSEAVAALAEVVCLKGVQKNVMVKRHSARWPTIKADMADASTNGLDAAKAGKRGWIEGVALRWAKDRGRYLAAPESGTLDAVMASGFTARRHTLAG